MNRTAFLIALVACCPFGFGLALLGLTLLIGIAGPDEFYFYWKLDGILFSVLGFFFFYFVFRKNVGEVRKK